MAGMIAGVLPRLIGIAAESYIPAVWGMQQERSLHKQSIRLASVQHIRGIVMSYIDASQEAGRDSMQSETDRNSTLLLLTTLMLGVAFAFVIEGRVTDLGAASTSQAVAIAYAASLGIAFATLVVTMMLVYTNQRRVTALMRAELAKRSAIRDIFVLDGVKHEVDLLREMGMNVPHRAEQDDGASERSRSASPGGRPATPHDAGAADESRPAAVGAAAPAGHLPPGGMAQHVGQLDAFASSGAREQHLKMGAYLRLSHHDQVYKVARRAVDKMLAVATVSLLVAASCVFGSALWVFSASAAPTAIFVVALGVGAVLSTYIGLSEARACSRKDGLSCCAMWRMVEHGVPVAAYDVLSYPQVWRRQLQATLALMASQGLDAEATSGQQSTLEAAKYFSRRLSRKDIEAAHVQAASGRRLGPSLPRRAATARPPVRGEPRRRGGAPERGPSRAAAAGPARAPAGRRQAPGQTGPAAQTPHGGFSPYMPDDQASAAGGDDALFAEEGDAAFFAAMEQEDGDLPDEAAVQDAFERLAADLTPDHGTHGGAPGPSPWSYKHSRARAAAVPGYGSDELV